MHDSTNTNDSQCSVWAPVFINREIPVVFRVRRAQDQRANDDQHETAKLSYIEYRSLHTVNAALPGHVRFMNHAKAQQRELPSHCMQSCGDAHLSFELVKSIRWHSLIFNWCWLRRGSIPLGRFPHRACGACTGIWCRQQRIAAPECTLSHICHQQHTLVGNS